MESIQLASMPDLSENIFCSPAFVYTFKLPTKKERSKGQKMMMSHENDDDNDDDEDDNGDDDHDDDDDAKNIGDDCID